MYRQINPQVNFPQLEKEILSSWHKKQIVKKYLHKNANSKKIFSFLDGPITANNPMGVHHAWGRTYKDLWQRFYALQGYNQRFQNGFDCQGLWVEVEVEKELGLKSKKDIENLIPGKRKESIAKFVELCKQRVRKYSQIQTEQTQRLGNFMDWQNSYYTMSDENNYMIWYFLKTCHQHGWIYKGRDSVPWCPRCETAISQHEMLSEDYQEVVHDSVYFKLPIIGRKSEFLLVWTTTPWTVPANIAVAVDESYDYALVEEKMGDFLWLAKELVLTVFANERYKIIKVVKGKELVGLKYQGAFDNLPAVEAVAEKYSDKFHLVVATDQHLLPVTLTEGTGLVHTAVSCGTEDFQLGKKLGLPMIPVIADNADYLADLGFLSGKNAKKNPKIILDFLAIKNKQDDNRWVFKVEKYQHRYPACWRCKTELVWKVADERYIAMDRISQSQKSKVKSQKSKAGKTLREMMVEVAKQIRWIPDFGLERELDWLKNMHDWLISKPNRYWGLALPIYECKACGFFEVIGSREELQQKAVLGWDKFSEHSPHKPWIDEVKIRCNKCQSLVSRLPDVGSVWLDAGIVPYSTLIDPKGDKLSYTTDKKYWRRWFPADFITESFPGQFKNWFYSMIAMSTVLERKTPFKTVLGFATLLGEDGRPMHKSWGNAIEFNEGADKIGVDVMRWMYCVQNPNKNMLFGYKIADETRRRFHLLLWNVYNFFISYANADNWYHSLSSSPKKRSANVLDRWIISRLNKLNLQVTENLINYNCQEAAIKIENFVLDLSQWYLRRSRDRVGPAAENKTDKENFYSTLYMVLTTLCRLLAPFIPFLSEEIYINLTNEESVHLTIWPKIDTRLIDESVEIQMELARKLVELGHSLRKEKKIKTRQPLSSAYFAIKGRKITDRGILDLILQELNIKRWQKSKVGLTVKKAADITMAIDTRLTSALTEEGQFRDLVRQIQLRRKEINCRITDKIRLKLPSWPEKYRNELMRQTLAVNLTKDKTICVEKI